MGTGSSKFLEAELRNGGCIRFRSPLRRWVTLHLQSQSSRQNPGAILGNSLSLFLVKSRAALKSL